MNGSAPRSNMSHLLRLYPITYPYEGTKKVGKKTVKFIKEETTEAYYIKGLKGLLRHQAMEVASEIGEEMCHTSEKTKNKHNQTILPDRFHLLGACAPRHQKKKNKTTRAPEDADEFPEAPEEATSRYKNTHQRCLVHQIIEFIAACTFVIEDAHSANRQFDSARLSARQVWVLPSDLTT